MAVRASKSAMPYATKYFDFTISIKQVLAEFTALTLFVFIGCGTAVFFSRISDSSFVQQESGGAAAVDNDLELIELQKQLVLTLQTNGNWGIITAMSFGMAIMFLVYTFGHISGGQINCAVTWGLVMAGHLGPLQGVCNFIGQLVGSLLGAGLLYGMVPDAAESSLGANAVAPGITNGQAVLGEIVMTFALVFVVLMTATWPKSIAKNIAPFAIGMVVFCAHAVLLPVDGCSINPTRSFGPAVVAQKFAGFWIFWVGPLSGATIAVLAYWVFRFPHDTVAVEADFNEPEVEFRNHKPSDPEDSPTTTSV